MDVCCTAGGLARRSGPGTRRKPGGPCVGPSRDHIHDGLFAAAGGRPARLTTAQCKRMSLLCCYAGTFMVQDLGPALADFLHERGVDNRLDGSLSLWGQGMTTRIEIDHNDTAVIVRVTDDNGRDQTATMPRYPHRGSDMYTAFADALDVMMYTWGRREEK